MFATYSPDDNKLRLYSSKRLDEETYARVRAAGFSYAPKQCLFVAPMWTPGRENLLIELCGEIGDEDTSLVERAEVRADRFEDYSAKRAQESVSAHDAARAIGARFEFGQPILVGHHSERKARKDAERIDANMRKSVNAFETSEYWTDRAAGALQHAKYKELPDVRHRRIKRIEADKRGKERSISDYKNIVEAFAVEGLTLEGAKAVANYCHLSRCFSLADFPRQPPASQYEGQMGLWSALDGGVITVEQAKTIVDASYPPAIARCERWIAHYQNRIAYERAMLGEVGALVGETYDYAVGGRVLVRDEWLIVLKINNKGGKTVSIRTNGKRRSIVPVGEVMGYREPDASEAAAVKAVMKKPVLCNYPGDGFVTVTKEQWDKCPSDYKTMTRSVPNADFAPHRARKMIGTYTGQQGQGFNFSHSYHFVFISDAKRVDPPALSEHKPATLPPSLLADNEAPRAPVERREETQAPTAAAGLDGKTIQAMKAQIKAGVTVAVVDQLVPTPPGLAERVIVEADIQPGDTIADPSAGGGALLDALLKHHQAEPNQVTAIEINAGLARDLTARYSARYVNVLCQDFLQYDGPQFDKIIMNPPFKNGIDIAHIVHAFKYVKPGGRLVAICAAGPRQQTILGGLAVVNDGYWEALPPETFAESGVSVRTALVVLNKAA